MCSKQEGGDNFQKDRSCSSVLSGLEELIFQFPPLQRVNLNGSGVQLQSSHVTGGEGRMAAEDPLAGKFSEEMY